MSRWFDRLARIVLVLGVLVAMSVTTSPDPACDDPDGNGEVPRHCVD
jgi:hypothetical protein